VKTAHAEKNLTDLITGDFCIENLLFLHYPVTINPYHGLYGFNIHMAYMSPLVCGRSFMVVHFPKHDFFVTNKQGSHGLWIADS
jgi:hypothetical protein